MTDSITITIERVDAMRLLYEVMSNASEEVYSAGWIDGLEEILPYACRRSVQGVERNGSIYVDAGSARFMCQIADALGHWVDMDANAYVPKCDKKAAAK